MCMKIVDNLLVLPICIQPAFKSVSTVSRNNPIWQTIPSIHYSVSKTSLCGRDGRTICGPLRVPKSTYVTLAHKRKPKFFYFGCSLVRRL